MVPLISYLSATMSPGWSEGMNEYSWPHLGQKPESRLRAMSQPEQKRLRSGTTPGTRAASGSSGGSGGRASGRLPSERVAVRLLRVDPERVLRVERVLRWLRVIGSLPEPVRVEPVPVRELAVVPVVAGAAAAAGEAAAMPHTLQ